MTIPKESKWTDSIDYLASQQLTIHGYINQLEKPLNSRLRGNDYTFLAIKTVLVLYRQITKLKQSKYQ